MEGKERRSIATASEKNQACGCIFVLFYLDLPQVCFGILLCGDQLGCSMGAKWIDY